MHEKSSFQLLDAVLRNVETDHVLLIPLSDKLQNVSWHKLEALF
jgi:hypothetical protein